LLVEVGHGAGVRRGTRGVGRETKAHDNMQLI
jgi:hypothetical protein